MRYGVVFPQTEIGDDPSVIREYAQAVESMGYDYILVYDHVLGADTTTRPNWTVLTRVKHHFMNHLCYLGFSLLSPRILS